MEPVTPSFFSDVKSFASKNKALCVLTLGLAVVGFSAVKLLGRAVSWIKEAAGVAKKTDSVSEHVLHQVHTAEQREPGSSKLKGITVPDSITQEIIRTLIESKIQEIANLPVSKKLYEEGALTYQEESAITEKGGVLLTKNQSSSSHYEGIVAMPIPNTNGYKLHLCPGGGYASFSKEKISNLMLEACKTLTDKNLTITEIMGTIGRHPGDTMKNFQEWQKDNRKGE